MSGLITGLASATGIVRQAVPTVISQLGLGPSSPIAALLGVSRSIGTIVPDVTIEEHHSDRMQVSRHPIANNTPISDHAYLEPATVTMRCGWSNSNIVAAAAQGFASGLSSGGFGGGLLGAGQGLLDSATEQRASAVYTQMLNLQKSRKPFQLTTGKRVYPSMLITEITVTTDRHSEYALMLECRMQEVILVSEQSAQVPSLGQQSQQQSASQTASPTGTGNQQAAPVDNPNSAYKTLATGGLSNSPIVKGLTWLGNNIFGPAQ
jgi:hypothetical protein